MKKHLLFRSFLALMMLLCMGNVWGEETTIFSYDGSGTTSSVSATVGTAVITGSNNTFASQKGNWTMKCTKTLSPSDNFKLTPINALEGGETITLGNYISSSKTQQGQVLIEFYDKDDKKLTSLLGTLINNGDQNDLQSNGIPTDETLTVPAAANGATYMLVGRNSGLSGATTTYISKLIISQPQTKTITSEELKGVKVNGIALTEDQYSVAENVITLAGTYMSAPAVKLIDLITYDDSSTETKDVDVEMNETAVDNFFTGTATIGETTYTVKAAVDHTVKVFFHYVENWNGTNDPYSCVNGAWSESAMASTTGADNVKWYTYTYNNTDETTIKIRANLAETQEVTIPASATGNLYYIVYNGDETDPKIVEAVEDPTMHTANIYFQSLTAQGLDNTSDYKMWIYDLNAAANTYGTTADYVLTESETYAGQTWYKASIHYFGDNYSLFARFKQGDDNWENAEVITSNAENLYVHYVSYKDYIDKKKKYYAGAATKMLLKAGASVGQTNIEEATTWDWTKAGSSAKTDFTDYNADNATYPARQTSGILLADVKDINNNTNFKSSAIKFGLTQRVSNGGKNFQGSHLEFNTTVAGYVKVWFSNTGSSARPYRYLNINGTNTQYKSNYNTIIESGYIPVPAGTVTIEGRFSTNPLPGDPTKDSTSLGAQYLLITKIEFVTAYPYTLSTADEDFYTLYLPFETTIPSSAKVYAAKLNDAETELALTAVEGTLPANSAVLVKRAGAEADLVFEPSSTGAEALTNNSLKGVLVDTEYSELAESGKTLLTLNTGDHGVGFYQPKDGATTLKANRAYLLVTTQNPAPVRIVMPNDVATAIENNSEAVKANKTLIDGRLYIVRDGNMFDLNGRLVK